MTKLRWTTQAVEDMEAIRTFIANDSDAYADLVVARLLEAVERLELFPRSGRIVPELADPRLREIIESGWWATADRQQFATSIRVARRAGPRCRACSA